MRYYDISAGSLHYSSLGSDGRPNPGALNVEIDITIKEQDQPAGGSFVRIWGPGIPDIQATQNLYEQPFSISGGMSPGLPLAKPEQAGLLCGGQIFQAYGNWVNPDMYIDIIPTAGGDAPKAAGPNPRPTPRNLVFQVKKGDNITDGIQKALQQAFPGMSINMAVQQQYTAKEDMLSFSAGLEQFAFNMRRLSQSILEGASGAGSIGGLGSPAAVGIGIGLFNNEITIADAATGAGGPIAVEDLIGQPVWIAPGVLQVRTVMRGDIKLQQTITLPQTLVTSTSSGNFLSGGMNNGLTFSGDLTVQEIRHLGNFRQPSADAWCSIFNAYTTQATGGQGHTGAPQ